MRTRLVLIQATSFCNIHCDYCYLPHRSALKRIEMPTLDQIYQRLFASPFLEEEVLFLWHAGEPLTLPRRFYEQAFALQAAYNVKQLKISNAIQTNATLINEQWCTFFREHGVHVGVSLDGPAHMHDAHRVDRQGRGTFSRTMRGVELLERFAIPYTLISVVTSASVREPEAFWRFFSQLKPLSLGLNPEEVEGVNESSSLQTEEDIQQYQRFVRRLLELSDQASPSEEPVIQIREVEKLMSLLAKPATAVHAQTNMPLAILSFDCAGNFSTFSPELLSMTHERYGDFLFGNVFSHALSEIFEQPKFQQVTRDIEQGIQRCQAECPYFGVCGGGSPSNKLAEKGTFDTTETLACRLQIQAPTNAVLEYLEQKYYLPEPA